MNEFLSAVLSHPVLSILFDLLLTGVISTPPILLYRYGIRRAPMEAKAAQKVAVVWGAICLAIVCGILHLLTGSGMGGASVVVWGVINHGILTRGGKGDNTPT